MRIILGILGIIAGLALGVYVGLWLCFIGGIIGILHVVMGLIVGKMLVGTLVFSVIKILVAGFAGFISATALIMPSFALIVGGK